TLTCPPEQQKCKVCQQETVVIGYERSEQLDVEPAKYFVLVLKREKRACSACERHGIVCAPLPSRIVEKGLVSDQVVIDTILAKYQAHLPLYRQSVLLQRDSGVEISRATMDHWVMHVGGLLIPVVEQVRHGLVRNHYLQADETPVQVQTHDRRGKNHQGYLGNTAVRMAKRSLTSA
ncbi:MAG: transposase, partial [Ktedonobacteraceae bacterium]|nr:transposase [Ktedonobacteraceae bacterium]